MQEGHSRADFVAAYQSAEAMNDNQPGQAVVYGGGVGGAALNAGKPSIEGRKELEADAITSAPVNSGTQQTGSYKCQHVQLQCLLYVCIALWHFG